MSPPRRAQVKAFILVNHRWYVLSHLYLTKPVNLASDNLAQFLSDPRGRILFNVANSLINRSPNHFLQWLYFINCAEEGEEKKQ